MERLAWKLVPPVVICEKSGQWATWWRGLKPSLARLPVPRLIETRSAGECCAVLDSAAAAFAVVELTPTHADAVLELLGEQERRWPQAVVAIVAERSMHAWEPLVREAGAMAWITSPRRLQSLVDMAARYAQWHATPLESVRDAVTASLPWR